MNRSKRTPYWRREILLLLEDGKSIVRTREGWSCAGDAPEVFPRLFPTAQLQVLANDGLINPDFKETGRATRQRELPLVAMHPVRTGDAGA